MAEFHYEMKIPGERVAILIGKKGETKRQIEQATKTKLEIDSDEGDIIVHGEDALGMFSTKDIISAIGRGFNPEIALLLLKQDYSFEVISLNDYIKSKSASQRVKGRVIGAEGKARRVIEELTECNLSVYGKTIAILGPIEHVPLARRAIESLLAGSPHANVYHWLEKQRSKMKHATFHSQSSDSAEPKGI